MLCSGLTAQSKLDLQSKMMLRELRAGKVDNSPMTRANVQGQTCVEAFIRYTGLEVVSQLEALGVKVIVNLTDLMTCSIPLDCVEQVSALEGVKLVSFAQEVQLHNDEARRLSLVDDVQAMTDRQGVPYSGKGVIYGTIDTGIDFDHVAFKNEDGTSRILYAYLPDQGTPFEGGAQLENYPGFVYENEAIAHLTTDDVNGFHGTHTLGVGAGGRNGHDTYYGMAPEADIIVAGVSAMLSTTLVNSAKLLIDKAKELGKPISLNMSLGNTTGPHDATDLVAAGLDQLTGPGAIITMSIGNDGHNNISLRKPADRQVRTLLYDVNNQSFGNFKQLYVEAWSLDGESDYAAQLAIVNKENGDILALSPLVQADGTVYEEARTYHDPSLMGDAKILYYTDVMAETGRRKICFARTDTTVTLLNDSLHAFALILSGEAEAEIYTHSGISLTDGGRPELFTKGNADESFNSTASGLNTITVGSYISRKSWTNYAGKEINLNRTLGDYSAFSSYGITLDGRMLPDISAPGEFVASSMSRYVTGIDAELLLTPDDAEKKYVMMQGTSMACPVVAGTIALWLQAYPALDVDDVHDVLEHTAIHDQFTDATPIRFGYGKIDAKAGLDYILENMPVGISTLRTDAPDSPTYNLFGQPSQGRGFIVEDGHVVFVKN